MAILRRCLRNVSLLNTALLAAAVALGAGLNAHPVGGRPASLASSPRALSVKEEKKPVKANPTIADFMIVADNNLFHPDRKIPPEKKDEAAQIRPEIVLYGTMMQDDLSVAFIEDKKSPQTTPGRGRRQLAVKKGDVVSGFAVTSIEAHRILLTRGGETMVVSLTDPGKQRSTDTPQAQAAANASQPVSGRRPTTPGPRAMGVAQALPAPQAPQVRQPTPNPRQQTEAPRGTSTTNGAAPVGQTTQQAPSRQRSQ
jgi:hypothetical protein